MKTDREMFELSMLRPPNYFRLDGDTQWAIDKSLGILDWEGMTLTGEDLTRFNEYFHGSETG